MDRYDENGDLTKNAHKSDHAFIKDIRDKAEADRTRKEKIKTSLITAFLWSVFSGIGAIIWYAFNIKIGGN